MQQKQKSHRAVNYQKKIYQRVSKGGLERWRRARRTRCVRRAEAAGFAQRRGAEGGLMAAAAPHRERRAALSSALCDSNRAHTTNRALWLYEAVFKVKMLQL